MVTSQMKLITDSPHLLKCLFVSACLLVFINNASAQGLDPSYDEELSYPPYSLGLQADGKLVTGHGYSSSFDTTAMFRFNENGSADSSFSFSGNALLVSNLSGSLFKYTGVRSVSCFLDGSVALSGHFDSVLRNGTSYSVSKILKVNELGNFVAYNAPLSCWDLGTRFFNREAPFLVSLSNNEAYIYGEFNGLGTTDKRAGIARLTTSGALVSSFLPKTGFYTISNFSNTFYHDVRCVFPQADGKLIVAGDFESYDKNTDKKHLVRITATGVLDNTFNPSPNNSCEVIAAQADGKYLVAGDFNSIGGAAGLSGIARLHNNGIWDSSFVASVNGRIYSMQCRVDGKIVIAGSFSQVNSANRIGYAVLNNNGTLADDYSSLSASSAVYGIALQNDGKIVLGGPFAAIGSASREYLARLTPGVPAVNTLTADDNGSLIEWTRSGSAPEIENAEFRMRLPPATTFSTLLGNGTRTATGWKLDKLKLPGNKTFDIQAKGLSRGGLYNSSTSVMSTTLTGLFRPLPVITSTPLVPQTVVVGDTGITFAITATSAASITYQWKRNNVAIPGATSPSYTIPRGVTTAQAGTYTCTVTSTAGSVTTSPGALLTVVTPITITKQPVFQAVLPGKPASFAVTVTGTSPQYQWFKGSLASPITIGTNVPTFKIPTIVTGDENDYWVEITNFAGMVRSDLVKLYEVTAGATVTTPPTHAIFAMNSAATLTASVASESPPVNQWLKNKAPVKGATSVPLVIPSIKLTDAGKYAIKTTNPAGSQTSTLDAEVAVVDQASTKHFVIAQNGTVSVTAIAAGNNLTYKWKKVGGAYTSDTLPGVTPSVAGSLTKTLTIKGLQTTDTAEYTCEVSAPGGMLESAVQKVSVTTGPPVITDPLVLPIGMVGDWYDYTVPVNGPAEITPNKFEAKGLPAGLKIDAFSGRITGRPSLAKSVVVIYPVTITASNGSGKALLSATANLEVRPITGVGALVGTYIGVIQSSALDTAFHDGGRIDLTTTTGGAYSGKLTLGSTNLSFKGGKLNVGVSGGADFNNRNSISIPRRGLPTLTVEFDLNISSLLLENGQITDGTTTSNFSGWKNQWSATNKALLYRGYYTMALEVPAAVPGDLSYPLGDGYAAFTVADLGTLTVAGRLADGTSFTTSTGFVGPTGQVAVYNGLYAATGGSLWSDGVTITSAGIAPGYLESTVSGSLKWTKRIQTKGFTYIDGFGPLNLNATGARYATTSAAGINVLGLDVLSDDVQLTYSGANVEAEPENPSIAVRLTDRNAFVVPTFASGTNPATTAISIAASTGILTTSFVVTEDTDPGSGVKIVRRTAKGAGIVVRNIVTGGGVGYGHFTLLQSPGSATSQVLSGRLRATDATP